MSKKKLTFLQCHRELLFGRKRTVRQNTTRGPKSCRVSIERYGKINYIDILLDSFLSEGPERVAMAKKIAASTVSTAYREVLN